MRIEEILELLEIDSPDEFEYFEHLAELIECPEEISFDAFYSLLSQVDSSMISELLDSYFEDLSTGIPDDATDFFTLITAIHQSLSGLCRSGENKSQKRYFIDELFRFRNWYTFDSLAHCRDLEGGFSYHMPAIEALSLYRMEKLGENKYEYDFTDALDYRLDEFTVPVFTISDNDEEEDEDDAPGENPYKDAFIDKIYPVIDGEFSDDFEDGDNDPE